MMDTVAEPQLAVCPCCEERHASDALCFVQWTDQEFRRVYPPGTTALAWRRGRDEPQEVKILTAAHNGQLHIEVDGERELIPTGFFISAEMSATDRETSMTTATAKRPTKKKTVKRKVAKKTTTGKSSRVDAAHAATSGDVETSLISVVENDRQTFDAGELKQLAASIKRHGVLQPLVVCPDGDGFRLIAGERRLRAAKLASLKSVPVRIVAGDAVDVNELDVAEKRLEENLQRVDLDPIERATAVQGLLDKGKTQKEVGEILGCNQAQVSNIVRLLQLPEIWQKWVAAGKLAPTSARALVPWAKRPQVLQRLVDKHSADIDEGECDLNKWKIESAVEFCTRELSLRKYSQYSPPRPDQCWFEAAAADRKRLDVEKIDGEDRAWNVEAWTELNRDRLKEAKTKYREDIKKRTLTGGPKTQSTATVNLSELQQQLAKQLSVTLSDAFHKTKHKAILPAVLCYCVVAEIFDLGESLCGKVKGRLPDGAAVVKHLGSILTKDHATELIGMFKTYFSEQYPAGHYQNIDEVLHIAGLIDVDLTVDWSPLPELLELFPEKRLRKIGAECLGVAEPSQPKSKADLLHWLEEDWPAGQMPAEVLKIVGGK